MTCIVGLEVNGEAWIGGDSAFSDVEDSGIAILEEPKVFHNGPVTFGCSGSLRLGQVLRVAKLPKVTPGEAPEYYVHHKLVPAFKHIVQEANLTGERGELPSGALTILAIGGKCFYVQEDFAAARFLTGEYAAGSGEQFALGSLHTTRSGRLSPTSRITKALAAASELSMGVLPPFTILNNV